MPLQIAPRTVVLGMGMNKRAQNRETFAPLVEMRPLELALETSKPETEGVDVSDVKCGASSFNVATQTTRASNHVPGTHSALVVGDFSLDLMPLHELLSRVYVALKRNDSFDEEKVLFNIGELHLDTSRHLVQKRGRPLHLTPKEFALLHSLMMNAGRPVPHRKLLRSIWGSQYGCEREYLRILVRQLRLKIEDNPANPKYLLTEPQIGYRFAEAVERDAVIPSNE
jgi:DNA-binding winged helix-turn-helix (wHTH) protein